MVEEVVCYARRARERVEREYRRKHENSPEGHDDHIVGWYARPYDAELDKDKKRHRSTPQATSNGQGRSRAMRR